MTNWITSIFAVALLLSAQSSSRSEALANITGVVVVAVSSNPVAGTVVELTGVSNGTVLSYSATTAVDGTFKLSGIRPGKNYQLAVLPTSNKYMPALFGQRHQGEPGTPITLLPDETKTGVRIAVTATGAIEGTIHDANGNPAKNVIVFALGGTGYFEGRPSLLTSPSQASGTPNQMGKYRIEGLPPGQYYVFVRVSAITNSSGIQGPYSEPLDEDQNNPKSWRPLNGSMPVVAPGHNPPRRLSSGYLTTFFPGTSNEQNAKPINLNPGDTASKIDMNLIQVESRRVRGVVSLAGTTTSIKDVTILLADKDAWAKSPRVRWFHSDNGSFDFKYVLPGSYVLLAMSGEGKARLWGRTLIEVGRSDVEGISIPLAEGSRLAGQMKIEDFDGDGASALSQFVITLQPDSPASTSGSFLRIAVFPARIAVVLDSPAAIPSSAATPEADGSFLIQPVAPWNYHVAVTGKVLENRISSALRNVYVKSVRLGTRDVLQDGMDLIRGSEQVLQVVMSAAGGELEGQVIGEDGLPASFVKAVLVPEAGLRERRDLYRAALTNATGQFRFNGITPGDYKLFAWKRIETTSWYDPEILRQTESLGMPVTIRRSASEKIKVAIIPPQF